MKNDLNPDEVVGGAIAIYNDVWVDYKDDINKIKSLLLDKNLNITFEQSKLINDIENKINIENEIRTSSTMHISQYLHKHPYLKEFDDKCNNIINLYIEKYKEIFLIDSKIINLEGFQLLKYEVDNFYKAHHDTILNSKRAISVLIYLNDDYDGGEIEFVNFNIKIKPKAGTLIFFPSNYPYKHIAHPVTYGTKYVAVTWLHER